MKILRVSKDFSNDSSANLTFSKTQVSKIQPGGFLDFLLKASVAFMFEAGKWQ